VCSILYSAPPHLDAECAARREEMGIKFPSHLANVENVQEVGPASPQETDPKTRRRTGRNHTALSDVSRGKRAHNRRD
jgi:hypothetical protein